MSISIKDTIRIGICGTGYWAEQIHLPVFADSSGFSLAGIFGRNHAGAAALAARFGGTAFGSFEDLLANVDAVSFAVPPSVQAGFALQAIRAGKSVLLEKPAATSAKDARALEREVELAGVGALVYLPRLYAPSVRALVERAREKGAVAGTASFRSGALLPGSPYATSMWRQDDLGALWDIGPHALTVLIAVFGPIDKVMVASPRRALFECVFSHAGGAVSRATLDLMDQTVDGFQERYVFEGPNGLVESGELPNDRLGFFRAAAQEFAELAHFGRADIHLGCDMVRILDAACRSVETGVEVNVE